MISFKHYCFESLDDSQRNEDDLSRYAMAKSKAADAAEKQQDDLSKIKAAHQDAAEAHHAARTAHFNKRISLERDLHELENEHAKKQNIKEDYLNNLKDSIDEHKSKEADHLIDYHYHLRQTE